MLHTPWWCFTISSLWQANFWKLCLYTIYPSPPTVHPFFNLLPYPANPHFLDHWRHAYNQSPWTLLRLNLIWFFYNIFCSFWLFYSSWRNSDPRSVLYSSGSSPISGHSFSASSADFVSSAQSLNIIVSLELCPRSSLLTQFPCHLIHLHLLKIIVYVQTAFKYVFLGHPHLLSSRPIYCKSDFLLEILTWMPQGHLKPAMSQTQLVIFPLIFPQWIPLKYSFYKLLHQYPFSCLCQNHVNHQVLNLRSLG